MAGDAGHDVAVRPWGPRLRRGAGALLLVAVLAVLVLPQGAGSRDALDRLTRIRPGWLVVGTVLEALSLVAYALLTRSMLPAAGRPSYAWLLRTDVTALGVSHLTPVGAAAGTAVRFRLLRQGGVPAEDALAVMALEGVGSAVVLNVLLGAALLASAAVALPSRAHLAALACVALIVTAAAALMRGTVKHPDRASRVARRAAAVVPRRWRARSERTVRVLLDRSAQLLGDRRLLRRAALWATVNWMLDAASLAVFLAAFGHRVDPAALGVAYGLANVLAAVPVTPGGLGVVEAVAVSTLVGFGAPRGPALLGVLAWRVVQFWLPIPAAAVCYASLQAQSRHGVRALRAALHELRAPVPDPSGDRDVPPARTRENAASGGGTLPPAAGRVGGMLVLSRRVGERLVIGDDIVVTVIEVRSDGVRLGIDAPRSVSVHRAEVLEAVTAANVAATDAGDDAVETLRGLIPPTPEDPDPGPRRPR